MTATAIMTETGASPKNSTRTALIRAAINIFGRDGFAAASTRSIAEEAEVNQALINYHFKTKQGLYLAVFEYINAYVEDGIGDALTEIETTLAENPNIEKVFYWQSIKKLLGGMLHMINSFETKDWSTLIIREQQYPTEAFAIMENGVHGRLRKVIDVLVARQLGLNDESEEAKLMTITLLGQIFMFKVGRATVLASMGWEKISAEKLKHIEQCIFNNFSTILKVETI